MRRQHLLATVKRRFNRDSLLTLVLAGGAICLIPILTAPFRPSLCFLASSFLAPFLLFALAPLPWQWTGDDRPKAGRVRGLLQALLINWIWVIPPFLAPPGLPSAPGGRTAFGPAILVWVAVTGFGWFWSEKEAAEARERAAAVSLRVRLEGLVEERTRELSLKTIQLEEAMEALHTMSLTDPLTGLRNRRYLTLTLPEDVAQVFRTQRTFVRSGPQRLAQNIDMIFLMVDVDHFKVVNDTFGHWAGDQVLCQLAEVLVGATRDSDSVVRWGGEEFLIVARNACRTDAHLLAERVRSHVAEMDFHIGQDRPLRCSCSVGFVVYPLMPGLEDPLTWLEALDLADRCLYAAKRGGRNAWVGLTPRENEDPEQMPRESWMKIEEALDKGLYLVQTSLEGSQGLLW